MKYESTKQKTKWFDKKKVMNEFWKKNDEQLNVKQNQKYLKLLLNGKSGKKSHSKRKRILMKNKAGPTEGATSLDIGKPSKFYFFEDLVA